MQSVIESLGIPTVSVSLLREVTERVRLPRALFVDRPLGYPLGQPHDRGLQRRILLASFDLLLRPVQEPVLVDFRESFE